MDAAAALRLADLESRRICRFCLRATHGDRLVDISGAGGGDHNKDGADATAAAAAAAAEVDRELPVRIAFVLSLEVAPNDGLPQKGCDQCLWLMERFYLFKDQCVRAEMLLRTFAECGVPLMQYFEPMDYGEFRLGKEEARVDVEVQTDEVVVEIKEEKNDHGGEESVEMVKASEIKQEVEEEEDWRLAEEPTGYDDLNGLAQELYGEDFGQGFVMDRDGGFIRIQNVETLNSFEGVAQADKPKESTVESVPVLDPAIETECIDDVSKMVTTLGIGSSKVNQSNSEVLQPALYEDVSNDTVEMIPATETQSVKKQQQPTTISTLSLPIIVQPSVKHEPAPSKNPKTVTTTDENDLRQTSDLLYSGLPTDPILEPGELLSSSSDDEETPEIVTISSDSADESPQYQCTKCDKFFPQSQQLDAHLKAYHLVTPQQPKQVARSKFHPSRNCKTSPTGKMAIMIDPPKKKCPRCGEMVHKISYWAHLKWHTREISAASARAGGRDREDQTNGENDKEQDVEELWE